jgi:cytochrome c oxidase assembly protein Cox11
MLAMLDVPLYHVLCNYSGIDRNIKRVENCLDTTGPSTNELDSSVEELIVI